MTSSEIRQSFLDFFKSKQHTIVPSSSLMPDSPNLLFTNAGMNQFVPIFLGQQKCPYDPGRAADTQKCIRAGGKHNDLEDVGLDTYHHTFFEMLGNWSFGDYFKREAIEWAWELVTEVWKFPKNRLYATVYSPDKSLGDPSEFDQEAYDFWAAKFTAAGLDPKVHIVNGNKKDNFWMMGETGPCGPCSELHVDLTPQGDTKGALVNKGTAECIEIWNLVFIQFNANPDGTFSPLPAKHVDTGMGFERVTSIIQNTKNFTDFKDAKISNYETDIFRPIFDALEKLSGKKYTSTLPAAGTIGTTVQEKIDIAFRVIADHIRTLSFAIADGIQPGNTDRNYVLRRILRRAVRYGRTLGFHEPFFYKLVEVLAEKMGDVFPEIRVRKKQVQETIRIEEEAFNKTLDRGIQLFNDETERLRGVARASSPSRSASSRTAPGTKYWKRRLPHYERPFGIYHVTFSTRERRHLGPKARSIILNAIRHFHLSRYRLHAACVMPDHVHILWEPQIKEQAADGTSIFWGLSELMHSIKSFTANEINKSEASSGPIWDPEYSDRLMRSDADVEEKFHYVCSNPWEAGVVETSEDYPWLWYHGREQEQAEESAGRMPAETARMAALPTAETARMAALPMSADFVFKLYDTYGFPLDLTELMARERDLTVDVEGFNKLMDEQRTRARAAQKKEVISLSQIETTTPTKFIGFETLETTANVVEVVGMKDKTAVVLDISPFYAEMGGQVGDTGELTGSGQLWRVLNTQKSGNTFLHFVEGGDAPAVGASVNLAVEKLRRDAIQRHHTVTHLLHWALHEVVSKEASQKGSFVGPEKLTFDFNSAPLTPQQVADVEKLVNERILENALVSWKEFPHAEVKGRKDVQQFFGDKYGDIVRVVQIGGQAGELNGYSMELCGGTHTRGTGEIGYFRMISESAIAAGVRRIEGVAGLASYDKAKADAELLTSIAGKLNVPAAEIDKKLESLLAHQKELEKLLKSWEQKQASETARLLLNSAVNEGPVPIIVKHLGEVDGDYLQSVAEALKGTFRGVAILAGAKSGNVSLAAMVPPELTKTVQAGKIIQAIAPIVGGKGGGRPDFARGGGKDTGKIAECLAKANELLAAIRL